MKRIIRKLLKAIDEIIDFINYIANTNLPNLPKFPNENIEKVKEIRLEVVPNDTELNRRLVENLKNCLKVAGQ